MAEEAGLIYLIDADILNYILKEIAPSDLRYRQAVAASAEFVLSPVVHYHMTRHFKARGLKKIHRAYDRIVSQWQRIDATWLDWEMASRLWADKRKSGVQVGDAHLLIAVCALKTGATLVTNNTRHFDGMGLTLENWAV